MNVKNLTSNGTPAENPEDKIDLTILELDFIAHYKGEMDDFYLHWGICRDKKFEWVKPEDKFLPKDSK